MDGITTSSLSTIKYLKFITHFFHICTYNGSRPAELTKAEAMGPILQPIQEQSGAYIGKARPIEQKQGQHKVLLH